LFTLVQGSINIKSMSKIDFFGCVRDFDDHVDPNIPGKVNRTLENRTQLNSIKLNPWIEFK